MNTEMQPPIFLSAGVPDLKKYRDPKRPKPFDEHYITLADPMRIRDAVMALVTVARDLRRHLVFGGQPGITTSVDIASESLGSKGMIHIFQSELFRVAFPPAALKFAHFYPVPAGFDLEDSLRKLREAMLDPNRFRFSHAIFLGGMNGLYDEMNMFQNFHPHATVLPVASTGGAAAALWDIRVGPPAGQLRDDLKNDLHYPRLFRSLLS